MDEFDDMMKMLGLDTEDEPEPVAAEGAAEVPDAEDNDGDSAAASNLDDELARLLAADREADDELEFEEITPVSQINSRSVYDSGSIMDDTDSLKLVYSPEAAAARLKKKRSILDGLTVGRLLTAGLILLIIFAGGGTAAVLASRAVAEQREESAAMAHFTPITMPAGVANNANFININERQRIGERDFTLQRMATGFSAMYFYFENYFDTEAYHIFLHDEHRHLYVRRGFDMRPDPSMGTVLRFAPLRSSTRFLTLHIQNRETGEYGAFYYRLLGSFAPAAPLFVNRPIPFTEGGDIHSGLRISHAYFNNVESVIYYSFNGNFNTFGLRRQEDSDNTFVHLWDNFGGLAAFTEPMAAIYCPQRDVMMGRATFAPLMSLHSQIWASFHDLYYVYPYPPVDIPLRFLSRRNQDDPHTLYMDRFRLNLEGLAQQGHLMVFVMHGLDAAGLRLRTVVEPSLLIDIGRGQTLSITAEQVNVADIGTDVVFNLRPYLDILHNVHIDRYKLVLHSVEFAVPEVHVIIDLADAVHQSAERRDTVIANITEAFISRMAYKSGEIAHTAVIGFAPAVLADPALSALFAPQRLTERAMYGASVIAGDFYDNYTFLAVVDSEWVTGTGAGLQMLRTTHQIIARSHEGIWSIVSDELITR